MLKPNGPRQSHAMDDSMKMRLDDIDFYRIFDVQVEQHEINKVTEEDI